MLSKTAIPAIIASCAILARADVGPNEPGPGESFNQGATCKTAWTADTASPTAWQNMSIELMSGSNTGMVHLTTVATGQDGTKAGEFTFPCPAVTPNSNIYFYQYSAPGTKAIQWTTRFIIASTTGESTPPQNPTQPDGKAIPWGTGALADPSTAVPAPSYLGTAAAPPAGGNTTTTPPTPPANNTTSASTPPPSNTPPVTNTTIPISGNNTNNNTAPGAAVALKGELMSSRAVLTLLGASLAFMLF